MLFLLANLNAFADIIVKGRIISWSDSDGNTFSKCRGRWGECLRIRDNGDALAFTKVEINTEFGTKTIVCDSYEISEIKSLNEEESETLIKFIRK